MADKPASSRKERSDLFKVEEATPSIAPVEKIVLPPEEALKRRIRRFIAAAIAALAFFYLVHLALGWVHDARVEAALDRAIDDASPDTIETALSLLRDDSRPGVRARLLATLALGGDADLCPGPSRPLVELGLSGHAHGPLPRGDPRRVGQECPRTL